MKLILLFTHYNLSRHAANAFSIHGTFKNFVYAISVLLRARYAIVKLCIFLGLLCSGSANILANENLLIKDQIIPIGSDYQNSIKILNNRFRVDSDVKEITIVFFRSFGSPPVVLVRPDGSKLYLEKDLEDDSFNWYETDTYDMVSLINPMPGPWQAVGDILPESRVMVIAGITLHADPIAETIFSGETIKHTAYLENGGTRVDMSAFRDIVTLSIEFVSTNNPNFPNFGLGSRPIAQFEDNGLGFDEYEGDGTFSGQFDLKISEGEWRPVFTVRTPLFSREQVKNNIVLLPTPVQLSHQLSTDLEENHTLNIVVDQNYIEDTSVVIDGSVRHPSGEVIKFSLTDPAITDRSIIIENSDYGIYKVNISVFAKTLNGRDIVLTVPEYSFVTTAPEVVLEIIEEIEQQGVESSTPVVEEEPESFLLLAIIVNIVLLLVGMSILALIVNKRNHPENHFFLRIKNRIGRIKNKQAKEDSTVAKA